MSNHSSARLIKLIDARVPGRPLVVAQLIRDYPLTKLDRLEAMWREAREHAVAIGPPPLEHTHWDWRNKTESVLALRLALVAIEFDGEPQGVMAVSRTSPPARLGDGSVVYVDYLESAPWNLRFFGEPPRFIGVGTALIADAVRLSRELGHAGRVGLHSLPQAESFYSRCQMTRVGPDPDYYDLTYFEYTNQQSTDWLASLGEFS